MDVLDNLCDKMKLYSARAGPEFPYIKGGMRLRFSQIRQYLWLKVLAMTDCEKCFLFFLGCSSLSSKS